MDYLEQQRTNKVLEAITTFVNETEKGRTITRKRFLVIAQQLHETTWDMFLNGDFGNFK